MIQQDKYFHWNDVFEEQSACNGIFYLYNKDNFNHESANFTDNFMT